MAIYPLLPGTPLYETRAEHGYRFRVERPIGVGGFGITYLATDFEFQGPCVIKEFALAELCARSESTGAVTVAPGREGDFARWLDRFEIDARQIHRIHHANVVRVRAVWRERGTAYYAMDLVEGARELPSPDQDDWTPMPWAEAEPIARGVLSALEEVHRLGMIHGDIKPWNVLLNQEARPVLIDFGTVRTNNDLRRTITLAVYTRGYAPPELTSSTEVRNAGPWSDLYSWAMVVWGLVMRHPRPEGRPVDAATRAMIADSGGVDRYVSALPSLKAAGVPDLWIAAIDECLRLDVASRPQSASAVLAAIAAPVTSQSVNRATDGAATNTVDAIRGSGSGAGASLAGAAQPPGASSGLRAGEVAFPSLEQLKSDRYLATKELETLPSMAWYHFYLSFWVIIGVFGPPSCDGSVGAASMILGGLIGSIWSLSAGVLNRKEGERLNNLIRELNWKISNEESRRP